MFFFTRAQYDQLIRNGSRPGRDHTPVVKLTLDRVGCTWLLASLDPQDPMIGFGLCDLGMGCPEMGPVDLAELAALKLLVGVTPQPDLDFIPQYPLGVYAAASRECGRITRDDAILRRHANAARSPALSPV